MPDLRLFRFGPVHDERPAVELRGGRTLDCSSFGEDWTPEFLARDGLLRLQTFLRTRERELPPVAAGVRRAPCLRRPGKLICIGLNYRDHAAETGAKLPAEPVVFFKATTAICGPDDDLVIPRGSTQTDWEVELAVVIGKLARHVDAARALDHVAG